jgi:glycosyltransferase involved in cell wall biosynthesis
MKILLLSHSENGGAGRAAYRLHQGMHKIGINSQMLVQNKSGDDKAVLAPKTRLAESIARMRVAIDAIPLKFYPQRHKTAFSPQWLPDQIIKQVARYQPDVINLHWLNEGYMQIETIAKLKKPIVWTLHDMWAFTGGCHYNQECDRYTARCGRCPQLNSSKDLDLSRWIFERKVKAWQQLNLTIVTPSRWLAKAASSSSLFRNVRVEVIPYGIETNIYKPIDRRFARNLLNLPQDKQLLLFGAMNATSDRRKGFHLLQPSLQKLSQSGYIDNIELVVFGASSGDSNADIGMKTHYLGRVSDDISLALIYASADVFIAPSIQDNLPNTVMEAIACGTPCVAFDIGGMPDMIEHQQNGYLAKPFDIEDLTRGIMWVLEGRHEKLGYHARQKAEQEFPLSLQAQRYLSLFNEICGEKYHHHSLFNTVNQLQVQVGK